MSLSQAVLEVPQVQGVLLLLPAVLPAILVVLPALRILQAIQVVLPSSRIPRYLVGREVSFLLLLSVVDNAWLLAVAVVVPVGAAVLSLREYAGS